MVYTSEIDEKFYQQAMKSYKKHAPELLSRITFLLSGNLVDFIPFLEKETSADCVFLDGSNNPQETVEQLKFFSSYMTTGAILMLHDWHSEKMTALRPLLLNSPDWILKTEIGQPLSKYGFAIFVKK